jgi:ribonuclease D
MHEWIASDAALADFFGDIDPAHGIGLDTEFVRERTYHAQLALVQIAIGGRIALLDPLAVERPTALLAAFESPALKLMHSPGEDLQAFAHHYGRLPAPLFDTQLAAALTGYGAGIGYQRLVETVLGVTLAKGETRSDWLRRPLSASQREYAADDVRHLDALYAVLAEKLDRLGRRRWLEEDAARTLANARDDRPDPHPHLSLRPAQRMSAIAQARLRRLLLWRDEEAIRSDKPRGWILDNDTALRLAERPPAERADFERFLDSQPKAPRRKRDVLWDLMQAPLSAEERDIPLALPTDDVDKNALKALQTEVAVVAAELELPDGLLCTRRQLEQLLTTGTLPASLDGWRATLVGERLRARMA